MEPRGLSSEMVRNEGVRNGPAGLARTAASGQRPSFAAPAWHERAPRGRGAPAGSPPRSLSLNLLLDRLLLRDRSRHLRSRCMRLVSQHRRRRRRTPAGPLVATHSIVIWPHENSPFPRIPSANSCPAFFLALSLEPSRCELRACPTGTDRAEPGIKLFRGA